MSQTTTCPECGRELPGGAPRGLCPACLLKRGLETNTIGATASPAQAWTPPTVEELTASFPELEIQRLVGRGGMGAVYQARQKSLDRTVALKILPPAMASEAAFADRFAREAQAMARLNHPHIVTIYEFGEQSGLYFFLMEFVDGVNLRSLLDSGHISPKEALAIVPQICDALQYAHDQGIVHRDIKPENILLNKQGQVKIADFGLAKLMGVAGESRKHKAKGNEEAEVTVADSVMGTPQYMAPEQKERPAEVDHRADIYSLGVVFYQMLTGELPKGALEPPSRKMQIDVRLDEIVLRALEREPERRYQQASQVKTEVETLAREEPVAVAAETAHSQRGPIAALRVALIVFAAIVALSVAAGGMLVLGDSPGGINGFEVMFIGSVLGVVVAVLSMLVWLLRALTVRSRGQRTSEVPSQTQTSGIPGTAIIGSVGLVLFGTAACWLAAIAGQSAGDWGWMSGTERLGFVLTQALFVSGFLVAPLATTMLGWTAVLQIRRSVGRLGGMPLALLDGLFFPLLALDAALMSISNAIFPYWRETIVTQGDGWGTPDTVTRMVSPIPFLITIAIVVALDVLVIRFAWRIAKRSTPASSSRASHRFGHGRQLLLAMGGAVLAFVAAFFIWRVAFHTPSPVLSRDDARLIELPLQAAPRDSAAPIPGRPGPRTPDGKAEVTPLQQAARPALEASATPMEPLPPLPLPSELPGDLLFHGRYQHKSGGRDISEPSELWVNRTPDGGISAMAKFPAMHTVELVSGDRQNRPMSFQVRGNAPVYGIDLKIAPGEATFSRRGIRQDVEQRPLTVPADAIFDPNSRPDSYVAANVLLRRFAFGHVGEVQEIRAFDWDNTGEKLVDYTIRVEFKGVEKVQVPAGTFEARHLTLTQVTSADTWFKKRAGHTTDFWLLESGIIVRALRHREPYEMVLLEGNTSGQ